MCEELNGKKVTYLKEKTPLTITLNINSSLDSNNLKLKINSTMILAEHPGFLSFG
jgi:hypothetical protein